MVQGAWVVKTLQVLVVEVILDAWEKVPAAA